MRPLWKDMMLSVFLGLILPGILLNGALLFWNREPEDPALPVTEPTETAPRKERRILRLQEESGTVREEDLEEYLVEAVLGEMPASFELEALKAQAVAARTYAQKAIASGGRHEDADLCTRSSCCQAYLPREAYLENGGRETAVEKVTQAVQETEGLCVLYEGALIEATYFSCSGGSTEDAQAVWGTAYPYLQAVASPGEEGAAWFLDRKEFTGEEFQQALGLSLEGTPKEWFGPTEYTKGGGVSVLYICGVPYSGVKLRSLLELRSTAFQVQGAADRVIFTTQGYGHRVGMSQYGADAMAVQGQTFRQILEYYYTGAKVAAYP